VRRSVTSRDGSVDFPAPPWSLAGQLWVTLLHLGRPAGATRPAGVWGAAFVRYDEPGALTYSELLVARPVPVPGRRARRVSITDIWVDSPASRSGGRELWAIPKELCDFSLETVRRGPLTSTEWSATLERRPIAEARFTDVSAAALFRTPFRAAVWQPGIDDTDGEDRSAAFRGTGKVLPCRGRWDFAADGPLGWLRGARQLASFRMADFRLTFG
jgi:acetoacetate decarboxylase